VDSKNLRLGHFGDLRCGQRRIFGPTGHENLAPGLPWEPFYNASSPHKALPRNAFLEKHPVRRVGGAEGAKVLCRRSNLRSACPDAPTLWRLPKKNSPWVNFGLRFSFSPFFVGARTVGNYPGVRMPFLAFARRDYTEQITTELYYLCRASYFYDFSKRQKE
jgi:hypothetical protein